MVDQQVETKLCSNCKRLINASNFLMHETFCLKNVRPCEICKEPIDQKTKDQHFEEFHAKEKCVCGLEFEKLAIEKHKRDNCSKRQVNCKYCQIPLNQESLEDHMVTCGTRTELCTTCNRYIKLQDQEEHFTSNCQYPIVIEKPKATATNIDIDEDLFNPYRLIRVPAAAAVARNEIPKIDTNVFYKNNSTRTSTKPVSSFTTTNIYDPIKRAELRKREQVVNTNTTNTNTSTSTTIDNNHDIIMLPCEFCGEQFVFETLIHHQPECSHNPENLLPTQHNSRPAFNLASLNLRDHHSNTDIPVNLLNDTYTTATTSHNIKRNHVEPNLNDFDFGEDSDEEMDYNVTHVDLNRPSIAAAAANTAADYDEVIPCEFCNELFPLDVIQVHQAGCSTSLDTLDGINRHLSSYMEADARATLPPSIRTTDLLNNNPRNPTKSNSTSSYLSRNTALDEIRRNTHTTTAFPTTSTTRTPTVRSTPSVPAIPAIRQHTRIIASGLNPVVNPDVNRRSTTLTTTTTASNRTSSSTTNNAPSNNRSDKSPTKARVAISKPNVTRKKD